MRCLGDSKGAASSENPYLHSASPGLGSRHPTLSGGVPHVRAAPAAPPACPEKRVLTTGRSLPHRVPCPSPGGHPVSKKTRIGLERAVEVGAFGVEGTRA